MGYHIDLEAKFIDEAAVSLAHCAIFGKFDPMSEICMSACYPKLLLLHPS